LLIVSMVRQSWTWVRFYWADPTRPTLKWPNPTRPDSELTWNSGPNPARPNFVRL